MYSSNSRSQIRFSVGVGARISSTVGVAGVGGVVLKSVGVASTAGVATGRSLGEGISTCLSLSMDLLTSPRFCMFYRHSRLSHASSWSKPLYGLALGCMCDPSGLPLCP